MKKRLLILLTLAGTCFPAFAQHSGVIFKNLNKEHNTSVSVTESHQTKSNVSQSAILLPPDTTKMVSGSHRTVLMTGQSPVKTKTPVNTSGREGVTNRWRIPESKNDN